MSTLSVKTEMPTYELMCNGIEDNWKQLKNDDKFWEGE